MTTIIKKLKSVLKFMKIDTSKQFKVVVTDYVVPFFDPEREVLEPMGIELEVHNCKTVEELISIASDADAFLNTYLKLDKASLPRFKNLKIIVRYGSGYDNIDIQAATELGIIVCRVPDYGKEEVADHTLALILASVRKLFKADKLVREVRWEDWLNLRPIGCLQEMTLGVIGSGRIGQAVIKKAKVFFKRILIYDPYLPETEAVNLGAELVDLNTLLRDSDVVTIHCPLTNDTYHLISEEEFSIMKPHAIIVNAARGPIIDEKALYRALKNGLIAGAAIDTTEVEPLPSDSPLLDLDNIIITPHVAWYSEYSLYDLKKKAASEIARFYKGLKPKNIVNLKVLEKLF